MVPEGRAQRRALGAAPVEARMGHGAGDVGGFRGQGVYGGGLRPAILLDVTSKSLDLRSFFQLFFFSVLIIGHTIMLGLLQFGFFYSFTWICLSLLGSLFFNVRMTKKTNPSNRRHTNPDPTEGKPSTNDF